MYVYVCVCVLKYAVVAVWDAHDETLIRGYQGEDISEIGMRVYIEITFVSTTTQVQWMMMMVWVVSGRKK